MFDSRMDCGMEISVYSSIDFVSKKGECLRPIRIRKSSQISNVKGEERNEGRMLYTTRPEERTESTPNTFRKTNHYIQIE